ncbi:hypothetical protein ACFXPN_17420 [Streptomyces griseorubiginosus]|uniref:hypothetical protein n=1 Tax=Streptomyces griseorubiginosus TaxID=67304 RepID=UPI0036ABC869
MSTLASMGSWAGATVALLALVWAVWWGITLARKTRAEKKIDQEEDAERAKREKKKDEARQAVVQLLAVLDDCRDRAVLPEDVTAIRRFRAPFSRLIPLHPDTPEIASVSEAINRVCDIQVPAAESQDHAHYQQQLGDAVGRLLNAADQGFLTLSE